MRLATKNVEWLELKVAKQLFNTQKNASTESMIQTDIPNTIRALRAIPGTICARKNPGEIPGKKKIRAKFRAAKKPGFFREKFPASGRLFRHPGV